VHTYEHLRAVAAAAYASGNPALLKALDDYLQKIEQEITPSGAPAGDEWISGRPGNATTTGYEYCSLQELMDGYIDLLAKTGSTSFGDQAEQLFFNAAQGARNPDASCIAYLKTDNSYYMTGGLNGDSSDPNQTRYKYSPVHQDVAVCCVPNAGRIAPYFIDRMWMRNSTGLVATLLGPCKVTTTWEGVPLTILEKTVYPDEFSFDFQIMADHPVNFTLAIRKPAWTRDQSISYPYTEKNGYYLIRRTWQPGESVHLRLYTDVAVRQDRNSETYFTHGPLVLARPIGATAEISKRYPLPGFFDYHYRPDNIVIYAYNGGPIEHSGNDRFEVALYDTAQRRHVRVWLKPMAKTILRQVTFPGPLSGFTQSVDRFKLDSLFDILSSRNLAMGAISIMQNGKIAYQRTVGKDHSPAATYRIGSITKVFTGIMIYELIDAKRLSLEDTLSEFFPDLPNAGKITIAEMLGHRSGLANFTAPANNFDTWKEQPQTHEQLLTFIRGQRPDFPPGTKADYNNSNFLLLGYILEKIYRKPYKDIVKERIIQKLGLHDTYYGDHAGFQGSEAASYKYFDNQWRPEKAVYLDNFSGAGAIISTPNDLCTFITAIFSGKFISKASLARMTRIEKDGYGWGMFSFGDSLHTGYGHNGKTEGFASSMQYANSSLVLETRGQQFTLDALSDREFRNVRFGFFFDFDKDGRQLVVHDAATTYWLHKDPN
jgi:CubicO group peptidase (beta-lactamase class C family)